MFGALKRLVTGKTSSSEQAADDIEAADTLPGLSRSRNGLLKPGSGSNGGGPMADDKKGQKSASKTDGSAGAKNGSGSGNSVPGNGDTAPSTSTLNQQIVQAATFTNFENKDYAPTMVATPPELMVGQTTGLAVQDAEKYMNAIMQIAVAAQAVAIKKAAENPVMEVVEIPLLMEIQKMVTEAVTVYGTVSTTAGTSSQTIISDFKSG